MRSEPLCAGLRRRRGLYLAVGFAGMFSIGMIYGWSIIKVPFAAEYGWDPSRLALIYSLSLCFYCCGCILGAALGKKYASGRLLTSAAAAVFGGYLLTSVQNGGFVPVLLSYCVLVSTGIGIAYNVIISSVTAWFPDRKGLASGALMMGFGCSVMALGRLACLIAEKAPQGWRLSLAVQGLIALCALGLCALVIRAPKPEDGLPETPSGAPGSAASGMSFKSTMASPSYWLFYLYGLLSSASGSTVIGSARDIALSFGADTALAATLVGALSLFNGLGRIVSGLLYDRAGRRATMLTASALALTASGLAFYAVAEGSVALGAAGLCLTGLSFGAIPTISSAFIASAYGMRDFSLNYSVGNTKLLLSTLFVTLAGVLYTNSGSFESTFIMLISLSVISTVLCFFIRSPAE